MNYLAHIYLAEQTSDSILGNLLADSIRNNELSTLSPGIQKGVRLHRQVDSFTDRHALVQRSICRISKTWGWFSGIIIDVYYDHLLALNWSNYAVEPLRGYVDHVYQTLQDHIGEVPTCRELIERLISSDRLFSYGTREGIADTLFRLSQRIAERIPKRALALENAMPDLLSHHASLQEDFREFFPELVHFVNGLKKV